MVNKNGKVNAARLKTKAHSQMSVGRTSSIGSRVATPSAVPPKPVVGQPRFPKAGKLGK